MYPIFGVMRWNIGLSEGGLLTYAVEHHSFAGAIDHGTAASASSNQ